MKVQLNASNMKNTGTLIQYKWKILNTMFFCFLCPSCRILRIEQLHISPQILCHLLKHFKVLVVEIVLEAKVKPFSFQYGD